MERFAHLLEKYNRPVPRYTSYPTVPHWQETPTRAGWLGSVQKHLEEDAGLSIYIHLPFCEKLCTYCGCNKRITKNHTVEAPYVETLLNEWKIYLDQLPIKPHLRELHLGGGTPTFFSAQHLAQLITPIVSSCHVDSDRSFSFEAHPASTQADQLQLLYELGFRRLSVGVQDVGADIMRAINRDQTPAQVASVTSMARSIGYTSVNYDLIYGLPFQRPSHMQATMQFVDHHRPDRIAFYSYAHVPWKSKGQRAFSEADVPMGAEKLALKEYGYGRLTEMGYRGIGMDHFALPTDSLWKAYQAGQMHRNFMGFTDQQSHVLLGLGCSAISETPSMYIQNSKVVEDYSSHIAAGRLAIARGHTLRERDRYLKRHISNLFCRNATRWDPDSPAADIFRPTPALWRSLQRDGIIELGQGQIAIKPGAEGFVRTICAAIDPYYQGIEANKFSRAI